MKLIELLVKKQLNWRFQKLTKVGLFARDVVPIKVWGEKKARLALLCESKKQVFAVVCVNTGKADTPIFTLLGHYLQAPQGIVLNKKNYLVELTGQYEGLQVPLIVAENVSAKKAASNVN